MHTKKIVVLPQEITESKRPVDSVLNRLESEMISILDTNAATDVKMSKYGSLFNRYRKLLNQRNEPFRLHVLERPEPQISDTDILSGLSEGKQEKAKLLLKFIRNNPRIEIGENGEIYIEGQKIRGSNIIDLVHDLSIKRKAAPPAIGVNEIVKVLNKSNLPLEAVGNKDRRRLFDQFPEWDE